MGGALPNRIDPVRLADTGTRLTGTIAFTSLPLLAPEVYGRNGRAAIDLQFGRDEEGRRVITGRIAASTEVICQRCMRPLHLELTAVVSLGIVGGDGEAAHLPDRYEPLVAAAGEPVALGDLVKDELLLNWPMTPRHAAGTCGLRPRPEPEVAHGKSSPFAALEGLRRKES